MRDAKKWGTYFEDKDLERTNWFSCQHKISSNNINNASSSHANRNYLSLQYDRYKVFVCLEQQALESKVIAPYFGTSMINYDRGGKTTSADVTCAEPR